MSKSTSFRVSNESSQRDRRDVQRNDARGREGGSTYHAIAAMEADAVGGRFAAREKSTAIGSGPIAYPALPASSPWSYDPVPPEEPFGIDERCANRGESHEVALSEARCGADAPAEPREALLGGEVSNTGPLRAGVVTASPPSPKRKSRKKG